MPLYQLHFNHACVIILTGLIIIISCVILSFIYITISIIWIQCIIWLIQAYLLLFSILQIFNLFTMKKNIYNMKIIAHSLKSPDHYRCIIPYVDTLCPNLVQIYLIEYDMLYIPQKLPPTVTTIYLKNIHYNIIYPTTAEGFNLPFELTPNLIRLTFINTNIRKLPEVLPPTLKHLHVANENLTLFPKLSHLSLIELHLNNVTFSNNCLDLSDILPPSLVRLYIENIRFTTFTAPLPNSLKHVSLHELYDVKLSLDVLPSQLETLFIIDVCISKLPESFPDTLSILKLVRTSITLLPMIPDTLKTLSLCFYDWDNSSRYCKLYNMILCYDDPYDEYYDVDFDSDSSDDDEVAVHSDDDDEVAVHSDDDEVAVHSDDDEVAVHSDDDDEVAVHSDDDEINSDDNDVLDSVYYKNVSMGEIIYYINMCNKMALAHKRMKRLNDKNIIQEKYIQRAMHPSKFSPLIYDETIEVDEFMRNYVNSL